VVIQKGKTAAAHKAWVWKVQAAVAAFLATFGVFQMFEGVRSGATGAYLGALGSFLVSAGCALSAMHSWHRENAEDASDNG